MNEEEHDLRRITAMLRKHKGTIGFLRDLRRMNVAITRARMKLIILGNADTLSRHRFYAQFVEHVKAHGDFVTLPDPTLVAAPAGSSSPSADTLAGAPPDPAAAE